MNEEEQLIRAVCETPEDDTVRLAYADWLDEQDNNDVCSSCCGKGERPEFQLVGTARAVRRESVGMQPCIFCGGRGRLNNSRAARAEFIRAQCEIAVLERPGSTADPTAVGVNGQRLCKLHFEDLPDLQRLLELRKRAEALLRQGGIYNNETRWIAETVTYLHGPWAPHVISDRPRNEGRVFSWVWRRGFVETITCLGMDWDRCGRWLLKRHPITNVRVVMQTSTMPIVVSSVEGVRLGSSRTVYTWDQIREARTSNPPTGVYLSNLGTLSMCKSLFQLEFPSINFVWAPLQDIPGPYLTGGSCA